MLTDEFWYMQDETKTNKLDEQDFLMVVIDVLGEINDKYAISEDQMTL
jgi:endo-alpha-1,4-polygalactosaminidase (GH114 family)